MYFVLVAELFTDKVWAANLYLGVAVGIKVLVNLGGEGGGG